MIQFYNNQVIKDIGDLKKYLTILDNKYIVYSKSEFLKYIENGKIIKFDDFNVQIDKNLKLFIDKIGKDLFTKNKQYIDSVMQTQNKTKTVKVANPINYDDEIEQIADNLYKYLHSKRVSYYDNYRKMCVNFGQNVSRT